MKPWTIRVCLCWLLISCTGCGPSGPVTYPVSGTVTWEGQPLADGQIVFTPVDGAVAPDAGKIINGTFTFRAQAGTKRVEIYATRESGPPDPVMNVPPQEQYIPARYNAESILTVDVISSGLSDLKFDLTAIGNVYEGMGGTISNEKMADAVAKARTDAK